MTTRYSIQFESSSVQTLNVINDIISSSDYPIYKTTQHPAQI